MSSSLYCASWFINEELIPSIEKLLTSKKEAILKMRAKYLSKTYANTMIDSTITDSKILFTSSYYNSPTYKGLKLDLERKSQMGEKKCQTRHESSIINPLKIKHNSYAGNINIHTLVSKKVSFQSIRKTKFEALFSEQSFNSEKSIIKSKRKRNIKQNILKGFESNKIVTPIKVSGKYAIYDYTANQVKQNKVKKNKYNQQMIKVKGLKTQILKSQVAVENIQSNLSKNKQSLEEFAQQFTINKKMKKSTNNDLKVKENVKLVRIYRSASKNKEIQISDEKLAQQNS